MNPLTNIEALIMYACLVAVIFIIWWSVDTAIDVAVVTILIQIAEAKPSEQITALQERVEALEANQVRCPWIEVE